MAAKKIYQFFKTWTAEAKFIEENTAFFERSRHLWGSEFSMSCISSIGNELHSITFRLTDYLNSTDPQQFSVRVEVEITEREAAALLRLQYDITRGSQLQDAKQKKYVKQFLSRNQSKQHIQICTAKFSHILKKYHEVFVVNELCLRESMTHLFLCIFLGCSLQTEKFCIGQLMVNQWHFTACVGGQENFLQLAYIKLLKGTGAKFLNEKCWLLQSLLLFFGNEEVDMEIYHHTKMMCDSEEFFSVEDGIYITQFFLNYLRDQVHGGKSMVSKKSFQLEWVLETIFLLCRKIAHPDICLFLNSLKMQICQVQHSNHETNFFVLLADFIGIPLQVVPCCLEKQERPVTNELKYFSYLEDILHCNNMKFKTENLIKQVTSLQTLCYGAAHAFFRKLNCDKLGFEKILLFENFPVKLKRDLLNSSRGSTFIKRSEEMENFTEKKKCKREKIMQVLKNVCTKQLLYNAGQNSPCDDMEILKDFIQP